MAKIHNLYFRRHWKPMLWKVCEESVAWLSVCLATYAGVYTVAPMESGLHAVLERGMEWLLLGWPMLLLVVVIVAIAAYKHWPRMRASYYDQRTDTEVIVECADLFEQSGQKVIHTVDTFDTGLGTIITPRSLHGAFLQMCQKQKFPLEEQLQIGLMTQAKGKLDKTLPGQQQRYPLGTVCPLQVGEESYALASFSHIQPDGSIRITRREYVDFLMQLWENLSKPNVREDEVNVSVMGNRFVDLPADYTTEQKIDLMIQTFFVSARQHNACKTLRICVHEKNALEVDFLNYPIIMKHLARRPELEF